MRLARYSAAELAQFKVEGRSIDFKCAWCHNVHSHLVVSPIKFGPRQGEAAAQMLPGQVDGNTGRFKQTCGPRGGLPFQSIMSIWQ